MDLRSLCHGVIDLCGCIGQEGGIPVKFRWGGEKKKTALGKKGEPILKEDVEKLVDRMLYYKNEDSIPEFYVEDGYIRVEWI